MISPFIRAGPGPFILAGPGPFILGPPSPFSSVSALRTVHGRWGALLVLVMAASGSFACRGPSCACRGQLSSNFECFAARQGGESQAGLFYTEDGPPDSEGSEAGGDYDSEEMDIEDIGGRVSKRGEGRAEGGGSASGNSAAEAKEMLTPALRSSLSRQGYKLIGMYDAHTAHQGRM